MSADANGAPGPAGAPTIVIHLDGQPHAVCASSTLADLVAALGHAPKAVATAVNGSFVARGDRAAMRLRPDDAVLLFRPIVGG